MTKYRNQTQFELFPSARSKTIESGRKKIFFRPMKLRGENLIVLAAILVMSMVVSYSLGVEKGRKSSFADARRHLVQWKKELEASLQIKYKTAAQTATVPVKAVSDKSVTSYTAEAYDSPSKSTAESAAPVEKKVDNQYTIQVASFKLEKYAKQEALMLEKKGFETLVMPKGNYMIVCVGQFKGRDEAKDFSAKLRSDYKDLLVRRM